MKKYFHLAVSLVLIILAFGGGTYYGFNKGVENYFHLENVLRSNIDVLRAKDLRKGDDKSLKHIYWHFEIAINDGIDSYNWYQNSGDHLFSSILLSSHVKHLDKSIRNVTSYRSQHPIDEEMFLSLCQLPKSDEDKEYCMQQIMRRKETVKEYGDEG